MNRLTVIVGATTIGLAALTGLAWTRESGTASPVGPPPVDGPALFHAKGCATCHDGPDSRSEFEIGPDLRNLPSVAGSRQPGLDATAYVERSITSPQSFVVPGFDHVGIGTMPALALSSREVDALVAYLLRHA
jgi:cytochrome c1